MCYLDARRHEISYSGNRQTRAPQLPPLQLQLYAEKNESISTLGGKNAGRCWRSLPLLAPAPPPNSGSHPDCSSCNVMKYQYSYTKGCTVDPSDLGLNVPLCSFKCRTPSRHHAALETMKYGSPGPFYRQRSIRSRPDLEICFAAYSNCLDPASFLRSASTGKTEQAARTRREK